ncbi:hypothetical protein EJB05_00705, partial [Eragrostis curvula]
MTASGLKRKAPWPAPSPSSKLAFRTPKKPPSQSRLGLTAEPPARRTGAMPTPRAPIKGALRRSPRAAIKSVVKPPAYGVEARGPRIPASPGAMEARTRLGFSAAAEAARIEHSAEVPHFELQEDPSFWDENNVQVLIRVRPLTDDEKNLHGSNRCYKQDSAKSITCVGPPETRFTFDHVACETIDQGKIFGVAGLPVVEKCMAGYNTCIFAYGQTGSGKTHTMLGEISNVEVRPDPNRGMIPRIFEFLFDRIRVGSANLKVAATNMNHSSSRSHSIFTCIVESKWEKDSVPYLRSAKLNLVDLAGSERTKTSGAEGDRLKEAKNINKSLLTLGFNGETLSTLQFAQRARLVKNDDELACLRRQQVTISLSRTDDIISNNELKELFKDQNLSTKHYWDATLELTDAEKQEVIEYHNGHEFSEAFYVIDIRNDYYMNFPTEFSHTCLKVGKKGRLRKKAWMKVCVHDSNAEVQEVKEWDVKLIVSKEQGILSSQWAEFAKDNKIKVGDILQWTLLVMSMQA